MSWALAANLVGGLFGAGAAAAAARKRAQAMQRQSAYLKELAAPYLKQTKYALPKMQAYISSYLKPKIGKENPYMKAAYGMNLANINRQKQAALGASNMYWGRAGNIGRARGEKLRATRNATEALNMANLNYGMGQQQYKDSTANQYMGALGNLANYGTIGLQPAMSAANMGVKAANANADAGMAWSNFYGSAGNALGSYFTNQADRKLYESEAQKTRDVLQKIREALKKANTSNANIAGLGISSEKLGFPSLNLNLGSTLYTPRMNIKGPLSGDPVEYFLGKEPK